MREFSYQDRITLSAKLAAGAMFIGAGPRDTATVDVQPYDDSMASREAAEQAIVEMRGDTLHVESPERGWRLRRSGRLRVDVQLPEDSRLVVRLAGADARCEGRFGDSKIDSASGDISITHVAGTLTVRSASGDVRVGQVDGSASVNSASGDIVVGYSGADLSADTASGDVAVERAGGSIRARTASGDLRVDSVHHGSVDLATVSGDVRIGITAGTTVWLDLATASGKTRSDLDHGASQPPADGAPDVNLRVRTASGDIELRRVPVPADA